MVVGPAMEHEAKVHGEAIDPAMNGEAIFPIHGGTSCRNK